MADLLCAGAVAVEAVLEGAGLVACVVFLPG